MSLNSRISAAAAAAALLGAMGCSETSGPPARPAEPDAAPRRALAVARVLQDAEAAGPRRGAAPRPAAREHGAPLRAPRGPEGTSGTDLLSAPEGAEYEAWWGTPEIRWPEVRARLSGGGSYVFAGMSHDGHIGVVDLGFELHHETRGPVMQLGPQRRYGFNPMGKYGLAALSHSIQVVTDAECGYSLDAQAEFRAFYVLLPLPVRMGPYNLPGAVSGMAGAGGYDRDTQPSCGTGQPAGGGSPDGGDGTQGGDGHGYWLVYSECHGDDYFVDGQYVGSIVTSCSSYAVYKDAE